MYDIYTIMSVITAIFTIGVVIGYAIGYYRQQQPISFDDGAYDRDQWRYTMPQEAIQHLEECFYGNNEQAARMKRVIELSIEHFAIEMADDAECARIIEERVFSGKHATQKIDIEALMEERKKIQEQKS